MEMFVMLFDCKELSNTTELYVGGSIEGEIFSNDAVVLILLLFEILEGDLATLKFCSAYRGGGRGHNCGKL
jgi:hypothetical protein